jgi:chlorite dismutase
MEKLNLFNYSSKELSLDAFLKYFILWSYESDNINKTKKLFLRKEDWEEQVEDIKVELQVSYGKKKADIVVYFKLNGTEELVVFENKTNSTTSTKQLESYKKVTLRQTTSRNFGLSSFVAGVLLFC